MNSRSGKLAKGHGWLSSVQGYIAAGGMEYSAGKSEISAFLRERKQAASWQKELENFLVIWEETAGSGPRIFCVGIFVVVRSLTVRGCDFMWISFASMS
jgi:hypothetical protein